jgi:hypothetical protein
MHPKQLEKLSRGFKIDVRGREEESGDISGCLERQQGQVDEIITWIWNECFSKRISVVVLLWKRFE